LPILSRESIHVAKIYSSVGLGIIFGAGFSVMSYSGNFRLSWTFSRLRIALRIDEADKSNKLYIWRVSRALRRRMSHLEHLPPLSDETIKARIAMSDAMAKAAAAMNRGNARGIYTRGHGREHGSRQSWTQRYDKMSHSR
jgi:hypothetical protein